jgi:tetratricopeptide (TPR) repeat protein
MKTIKQLHAQASRLVARGDYSAADVAFRRAIRDPNRVHGFDPLFLAALLNDFGVLCKSRGRFALAERAYRRALPLIASSRWNPGYKEALATLYHNLGGIAHARGRYAKALRYARRGIAIRKSIRPRDPLALAADEAALAAILADAGRTAAAATLYLRALRTLRRIIGARHREVGSVLSSLGALYARTARPKEAERALRLGVTILEEALGKGIRRSRRR